MLLYLIDVSNLTALINHESPLVDGAQIISDHAIVFNKQFLSAFIYTHRHHGSI